MTNLVGLFVHFNFDPFQPPCNCACWANGDHRVIGSVCVSPLPSHRDTKILQTPWRIGIFGNMYYLTMWMCIWYWASTSASPKSCEHFSKPSVIPLYCLIKERNSQFMDDGPQFIWGSITRPKKKKHKPGNHDHIYHIPMSVIIQAL